MKVITSLLVSFNFLFCFGQTFTLKELENYSEFDFDMFTQKIMTKGYEFSSVDDEVITFNYTGSSVKNIYFVDYFDIGIAYTTTYKENYINLTNEIRKNDYQFIKTSSESSSRIVCNFYENDNYIAISCLGSVPSDYYEYKSIPFYEIRILSKRLISYIYNED